MENISNKYLVGIILFCCFVGIVIFLSNRNNTQTTYELKNNIIDTTSVETPEKVGPSDLAIYMEKIKGEKLTFRDIILNDAFKNRVLHDFSTAFYNLLLEHAEMEAKVNYDASSCWTNQSGYDNASNFCYSYANDELVVSLKIGGFEISKMGKFVDVFTGEVVSDTAAYREQQQIKEWQESAISLDEIYQAFYSNKIKAERTYKGKTFIIGALVEKMFSSTSFGSTSINYRSKWKGYTNDESFSDLDYPAKIIMRAKVVRYNQDMWTSDVAPGTLILDECELLLVKE